MAERWHLNASSTEGAQWWTCWTTAADVATAIAAGGITDAHPKVRKGDFVDLRTGCTGVTTVALRAAFTAAELVRASADATDAGALDLTDGTTMADTT